MIPKISIIIPCYNVEKYIDKCINSLLNQTIGLDNLQLIFVNDASTDNTLSILTKYEKEYSDSILIIDCVNNRKQGTARNIGIEYSTADYIGFVDSDDYIDERMYEKLYNKIVETNCDVVCCGYFTESESGDIIDTHISKESYITLNNIHDRKKLWTMPSTGGIVDSLYKKSVILHNNIFFPENIAYEDNYWGRIFKIYIDSIYIISEPLYHYIQHPNSTIHSFNNPHHFDRLTIELMKIDKFKELNLFDLYHDEIELEFLNLFYSNSLHIFFTRFDPIPIDIINFMQEKVLELFPNWKNNFYLINFKEKYYPLFHCIDKNMTTDDWNNFCNIYLKTFHNK